MALVQRTRFTTLLKNITGFRGPSDISLGESISPTWDISNSDGLFDDEVAYWVSATMSTPALAANFSGVQVVFPANAPIRRATVDGLIIRPVGAAATAYSIGLTAAAAAPTAQIGCFLRNPFLNQRGSAFGSTNQFFALNTATYQQAATLFGLPAGPITMDLPAGNTDLVLTGNLFPYVIQPNWCLTVESGPVNQQVAAAFWGRYVADQQ